MPLYLLEDDVTIATFPSLAPQKESHILFCNFVTVACLAGLKLSTFTVRVEYANHFITEVLKNNVAVMFCKRFCDREIMDSFHFLTN